MDLTKDEGRGLSRLTFSYQIYYDTGRLVKKFIEKKTMTSSESYTEEDRERGKGLSKSCESAYLENLRISTRIVGGHYSWYFTGFGYQCVTTTISPDRV